MQRDLFEVHVGKSPRPCTPQPNWASSTLPPPRRRCPTILEIGRRHRRRRRRWQVMSTSCLFKYLHPPGEGQGGRLPTFSKLHYDSNALCINNQELSRMNVGFVLLFCNVWPSILFPIFFQFHFAFNFHFPISF